jgi:virginiamycin B lyase
MPAIVRFPGPITNGEPTASRWPRFARAGNSRPEPASNRSLLVRVRVDAETEEITRYALAGDPVNLNTATFDGDDVLWFTGQEGVIGSVNPDTREVRTFAAPRGKGPYGIATDPDGEVWFGSLAGSYLGEVDRATGEVRVINTPTPGGGARRVWADSDGRLWITQWFAGSIARYDPATETWADWDLPGPGQPYAVYVDEADGVWVSDFGGNALHRFDPGAEEWTTYPHEPQAAEVRQLLGRDGEVWGAESATDRLVVMRSRR